MFAGCTDPIGLPSSRLSATLTLPKNLVALQRFDFREYDQAES
jgi:hypothetical protein